MNIANFIFRLFHIHNLPTLSVPTPFHSPLTPSANCAHLYIDYEKTFGDCTNFFTDYAHKSHDCTNTPDD